MLESFFYTIELIITFKSQINCLNLLKSKV